MCKKQLFIINILNYSQKHIDENHRLSQNDIIEILDREYNMKSDRKSVKQNPMKFIEFGGYDIEYSESLRIIKNKKGEN